MVYSTCSFSYEEDEEVIMHLLNNTNAEIIDIENNPLFYKSKSNLGIHLFPHLFPGEGHYICLIKKPGFIGDKTKNIKQDSLFAKLKLHSDYNYTDKYQNTLFIHDVDFALKKLSIIRYGVKVGEVLPNDIKYDIHYARYIKDFDNVLELDEASCLSYLKGNALNIETKKGYILLRYNGINIDLAKSDSRIIKNHYPKHMRIK
jgi:NOL1/NOP2/fmu family ribosome biogenesis protein